MQLAFLCVECVGVCVGVCVTFAHVHEYMQRARLRECEA